MLSDILIHGIGTNDLFVTATRILAGSFFAISGYHKLFNPVRHESLVETLEKDGAPNPKVNQWVIPAGEFFGGIALILGFLTVPAAIGLIIICTGAVCLDGLKRIKDYSPLDKMDWVDDFLYLAETLYIFLLVSLVLLGAGTYSLDNLFFG